MTTLTLPRTLRAESTRGTAIAQRYQIAPTEFGPQTIYRLYDPEETATTWGYVAIDNLARGRGLGGIRLAPDVTADEVYGLAAAMTLKSAAALLPLGGAKCGLCVDPRDLSRDPEMKR